MKTVLFLALCLCSASLFGQCANGQCSVPQFRTQVRSAIAANRSCCVPQVAGFCGGTCQCGPNCGCTPESNCGCIASHQIVQSAPSQSTIVYSQPVYSQPVYSQPIYWQPAYSSGSCAFGACRPTASFGTSSAFRSFRSFSGGCSSCR